MQRGAGVLLNMPSNDTGYRAGANIGIHSRFLFEPDKFPRSSFREVFDRFFGIDRDASTTCAVAFEPNVAHRAHHAKQRAVYARRGWRYIVKEAAVCAVTKPGRGDAAAMDSL